MAHTKSARKRIRQDQKRQLRNQAVKTRIRSLTKKFRAALGTADGEQTAAALKETIQALDKASTKGILHHKTASRRSSRLAKAAHKKLSTSASEASAAS